MDPPYLQLVQHTVSTGLRVPSRYGTTFERLGVTTSVVPGEYGTRPSLAASIGVLEGLFLVGGFFDLDLIKRVAPRADHSLFTLNGAYGPRVSNQLPRVIEGIHRDPTSRQHVLYVAQPGDQYQPDTPCTNSIQFIVRDNSLLTFVAMRSSDILKGLPTDFIQFGILAQVVAACFNYVAKRLTIFAASSHAYNEDLDRSPTGAPTRTVGIDVGFTGLPMVRFHQYSMWARAAAYGPWTNGLPEGLVRE
jgi:thymidylate synthase